MSSGKKVKFSPTTKVYFYISTHPIITEKKPDLPNRTDLHTYENTCPYHRLQPLLCCQKCYFIVEITDPNPVSSPFKVLDPICSIKL